MFFALLLLLAISLSSGRPIEDGVDILIAGGSLSALAAAITAANLTKANPTGYQPKIILLEPTDWPGGQLTASNVPPDFGPANHVPENLPTDFVNLLLAVAGPSWSSNPGHCWVSYKCFQAQDAVTYIKKWLTNFPSLHVYYNTVVKSSKLDTSNKISEVVAIQRTPIDSSQDGYEDLYSEVFDDWYSPIPSKKFDKQVLTFTNVKVVVEATEYADILMTSGLKEVSQGVETPLETSDETDSLTGQSIVFPFHMTYDDSTTFSHDSIPAGSDFGQAFTMSGLSWQQVWTYRRVLGTGDSSSTHVFSGEVSNQNLDNDYALGYLFLSMTEAIKQTQTPEGWSGGVNRTTLSNAEQRSFAWFQYLVNQSEPMANINALQLSLNNTQTGTKQGLAKMPYLRDSRRVKYGIDHFRLTYSDLNYTSSDGTARQFADVVGIGNYHYADIHPLKSAGTVYPTYITCCEHPVNPYYLPFRALTSEESENLLCAGKTMAQSFLANAATRLHPTEWASGTAAGAAAYLMASDPARFPTTRAVYNEISVLQQLLQSEVINSPLTWTLQR